MSTPASSQRRICSMVGVGVGGQRVGHRLDGDRRVAADRHGPDHDLPRFAAHDVAIGADAHGAAIYSARAA